MRSLDNKFSIYIESCYNIFCITILQYDVLYLAEDDDGSAVTLKHREL